MRKIISAKCQFVYKNVSEDPCLDFSRRQSVTHYTLAHMSIKDVRMLEYLNSERNSAIAVNETSI